MCVHEIDNSLEGLCRGRSRWLPDRKPFRLAFEQLQLNMAASLAVGKKAEIIVDPAKMDDERARLWKQYGGFCAIKDWHPALAGCTPTHGTATWDSCANQQ